MNTHKVIRNKTLGAWKKNAEAHYDETPESVREYIAVLEEELSTKDAQRPPVSPPPPDRKLTGY